MAKSALIDDLEKQFAENPRRVFARLANEYRKAGELETAIEICRAHVPLQPTYISGYIVLGQALFESGQLDEARSTFETALGLDPENLIALRQLGDIARAGGDVTGARGWYRRLLEVDPQNDEIVALVDELAAEQEGQGPAPPAPPPISWGDINPEQPPVEAAPPDPAAQVPVEPPAPAPEPAPAAPTAPPAPVFEPLDLSDLQFGEEETTAPPPRTEAAEGIQPAAVEGFDFESLSSFGLESFGAGHADIEGIERADELFSPDASKAGQPIPGLEIEGLERSGYPIGDQTPAVPEAEVLGHPAPSSPFGDVHDDLPGVAAEEAAPVAPAAEPAAEAPAEPPGEQPPMDVAGREDESAEAAPPAFVTETMAELYLRQGHRDAALDIYRQLASQRPDDATLRERIAQLEQPEEQGEPEHTVRAFFARLALKHPPYAGTVAAPPASSEPPAFQAEPPVAPPPVAPPAMVEPSQPAMPVSAPEPAVPEVPQAETSPDNLEAELGFTAASAPAVEVPVIEAAEPAAVMPEPVVREPVVPEPPAPEEPAVEERPVAELLFGELEPPPLPEASPAPEGVEAQPEPLVEAALEPEFPPPVFAPVAEEPAVAAPEPAEPEPFAEAAPTPEPGVGVEELLAAEAPSPDDEMAAASLAGAFSPEMAPPVRPGPVGGQPARAASDPLSLDTVFREGRGGLEGRPQSSVSFDEFFAGEPGAVGASDSGSEASPGADSSPDRDLELFQAWLEGLKK